MQPSLYCRPMPGWKVKDLLKLRSQVTGPQKKSDLVFPRQRGKLTATELKKMIESKK